MSSATWRKGQTDPGTKLQSNLRSFLAPKDADSGREQTDKMAPEPKPQKSAAKASQQQHPKVGPTDAYHDGANTSHTPQTTTYLFDGMPVDIGELFCSIPTKDDIRAMAANLKETHCREL